MGTFTFTLSNGNNYAVKTMLESESCFFVDPDSDKDALAAFEQYRNEQEDKAFENQPPELFKFYEVKYCDDTGRNYRQLIGADSESKAKSLFKEYIDVKVVKSYEKYCNFAALTMDEAAAQCCGLF